MINYPPRKQQGTKPVCPELQTRPRPVDLPLSRKERAERADDSRRLQDWGWKIGKTMVPSYAVGLRQTPTGSMMVCHHHSNAVSGRPTVGFLQHA